MGQEFSDYLRHVIVRVSENLEDEANNRPPRHTLNLQNEWPRHPNSSETISDWRKISTFRANVINRSRNHADLPGAISELTGPTSDQLNLIRRNLRLLKDPLLKHRIDAKQLLEESVCMADGHWRLAMEFLARASAQSATDPDLSVVDRFCSHIVKGAKPNLTHKMLAQLVRPLHIRVMLTTNFDSLLEQALEEVDQRFDVFNISRTGHLPSHRSISAQDALVKLHGGLHEVRADMSLDAEPHTRDLNEFVKCLSVVESTSLLVIGYSGSDGRCVELMREWIRHDPSGQIYWIAFNEREARDIRDKFCSKPICDQVFITCSNRPDLTLYELYQTATHCLPEGGSWMQFTHKTPPDRRAWPTSDESQGIATRIVDQWRGSEAPEDGGHWRIDVERSKGIGVTFDMRSGATEVLRAAFEDLLDRDNFRPPPRRMWIELQDYSSPESAAAEVVRVIGSRVGMFNQRHAVMFPGDTDAEFEIGAFKSRMRHLSQSWQIEPSEWLIFFLGRDIPGSTSGWVLSSWTERQMRTWDSILQVLRELGFHYVHSPFTRIRRVHQSKKAERVTSTHGQPHESMLSEDLWELFRRSSSIEREVATADLLASSTSKTFDKSIENSVAWVGFRPDEASARTMFLYAATLFRQSRHMSALISEGAYHCPYRFNISGRDNDRIRHERVDEWVGELSDFGVFLRKSGGYQWQYRDVRASLNRILGSREVSIRGHRIKVFEARSRTHMWIGHWYLHAFFSTGHSIPLVESVYHRIQSVLCTPTARPLDSPTEDSTSTHRCYIALVGLLSAIKTLRLGRASIKYWMTLGNRHLFLDVGTLESRLRQVVDSISEPDTNLRETLTGHVSCLIAEMHSVASSLAAENDVLHGKSIGVRPLEVGAELPPSRPGTKEHKISFASENVGAPLPRCIEPFRVACEEQGLLDGDSGLFENVQRIARGEPSGVDAMRDSMRSTRAAWARSVGDRSAQPRLIQILTELGYMLVKRAKMEHLCEHPESRHTWRACSMVLNLAIDLCGGLPTGCLEFEMGQLVKAHSLYGLALGYLRRPHEAHRRLSEANGLASMTSRSSTHVPRAVNLLRRAEVHLMQASSAAEGTHSRSVTASLEDAWCTLERAELLLSRHSRSSLWWGLLTSLQLQTLLLGKLTKSDPDFFSVRSGRELENLVDDLVDRGLAIHPHDVFRRSRIVHLGSRLASPSSLISIVDNHWDEAAFAAKRSEINADSAPLLRAYLEIADREIRDSRDLIRAHE